MDSKPNAKRACDESEEKVPAKTDDHPDDGEESNDTDLDDSVDGASTQAAGVDETTRLRREKRLAKNRESARARRKRKKLLIENLEFQVAELTKSNNDYRLRVSELEKELQVLKQAVQVLSRSPANVSMQKPNIWFDQATLAHATLAQSASSRPFQEDASGALKVLLDAQNVGRSLLAAGPGAAGHASMSEQFSRVKEANLQNLAFGGATPALLASLDPQSSAAAWRVPLANNSIQNVAARLGMAGVGSLNHLQQQPGLGSASADAAFALERDFMLQQQGLLHAQINQTDPATAALLLQQILQDQSALPKKSGPNPL